MTICNICKKNHTSCQSIKLSKNINDSRFIMFPSCETCIESFNLKLIKENENNNKNINNYFNKYLDRQCFYCNSTITNNYFFNNKELYLCYYCYDYLLE